MTKLEVGHVIRLRSNFRTMGNVRFRVDENTVRIMWAELSKRDTNETPADLEVQIPVGKRLVWEGAS